MNAFLLELVFISILTGMIVLLIKLLSPFFKSRYAVGLKQLLWVLLALRLIVVVSYNDTFFSINSVEYQDGGRAYAAESILSGDTKNPDSTYMTVPKGAASTVRSYEDIELSSKEGYAFSNRVMEVKYNEDTLWSLAKDEPSLGERIQRSFYSCLSMIQSHTKVLMGVYLAGIVCFLAFHGAAAAYFRRKRKAVRRPVTESSYQELLEKMAERCGVKKLPQVYTIKGLASPMAVGFFRYIIYIPEQEYKNRELATIFAHELTHIRHQDLRIKVLYLMANAMHWFNPLIYLMVRQAGRDMELYCDRTVVELYDYEERQEYNELLLEILKNHSKKGRQEYLTTCFQGGVKEMKERFLGNLDMKKKRAGMVPTLVAAVVIALSAGIFSIKSEASEKGYLGDSLYMMASQNNVVWRNYELGWYDGQKGSAGFDGYIGIPENEKETGIYSMGEQAVYDIKPQKESSAGYTIPIHFNDDTGKVYVDRQTVEAKGQPLKEIPKIQVYCGDTAIEAYGVSEDYWSGEDVSASSQQGTKGAEFFAQQCPRGEENPLFYVKGWRDYEVGQIRLFFPDGELPDAVDVEDVVLNEDGSIRYPGYPAEVIFRGVWMDQTTSAAGFSLAEHYSISAYETPLSYEELVQPYYRGYRIKCYWGNEKGLQSCSYYIVLRTQTTIYDNEPADEQAQNTDAVS